jgi:hypothetical protein
MIRSTFGFLLAASALFLGALPASSAHAQPTSTTTEIDPIDIPPEHDPLAHAWDQPMDRGGFYLRGTIGLGYQNTHLGPAPWKESDQGRGIQGFANGFSLDAGYMLAPWVALHATAHAGVLWSGDLNRTFGLADDLSGRVAAYGGGLGATFFTRRDFYMGLAAGVGAAHSRYPGYNRWTDPGFFMSISAGKDLYTGRNFAFGLQMQFVYMLLGANHAADEARVRQFLVGFSFAFDSI